MSFFSGTGSKDQKKKEIVQTAAKVAGALVVVGAVASAISILFSSGSAEEVTVPTRKVMKAPGQKKVYMFRDDFVSDPKTYFKSLRDR